MRKRGSHQAEAADVDVTPLLETQWTGIPVFTRRLAHALGVLSEAKVFIDDTAAAFAEAPDPRCRLLANFGVGYNHIDAEAATRAGVMVSNTPGAVTDATADIALTLILMTARRAGEGERAVRADRWTGWTPTQMLGMHVTGKTLGIIGMGRIGKGIRLPLVPLAKANEPVVEAALREAGVL